MSESVNVLLVHGAWADGSCWAKVIPLALSKQGPPSAGSSAIGPDDHGFLWINREGFQKAFAADATATESAVMADRSR